MVLGVCVRVLVLFFLIFCRSTRAERPPERSAGAVLRGEAGPEAAEEERAWWGAGFSVAWEHTLGHYDDILSNPFKALIVGLGFVFRPITHAGMVLGNAFGFASAVNSFVPALSEHNITTLYAYYTGYTKEL